MLGTTPRKVTIAYGKVQHDALRAHKGQKAYLACFQIADHGIHFFVEHGATVLCNYDRRLGDFEGASPQCLKNAERLALPGFCEECRTLCEMIGLIPGVVRFGFTDPQILHVIYDDIHKFDSIVGAAEGILLGFFGACVFIRLPDNEAGSPKALNLLSLSMNK